MKRLTTLRLSFSLSVVVAVVALLLVNLAGGFLLNSRFDLTENSIFTLSDGSRNIVEQLDEPIVMRLYYSESLSQELGSISPYASRVRSLLQQYEAIGDGKIKLEFIDPEPFSPQEDQATALGLQSSRVGGNNQQFYFGLVVSDSVDANRIIPFLNVRREPFLEYDITKLIYELTQKKRPVVGILSWLPDSFMSGEQRLIFLQQIEDQYNLQTIATSDEKLPQNLDTLLIIHPQPDLNESLAYAIDQYLLDDGKVVVFVDPLNEDRQRQVAQFSDMKNLFASWGVEYRNDNVVGDLNSSLRVNVQSSQGARAINHPTWLQLGSGSFNTANPITAQLNQVRFISSGGLAKDESIDGIEFVPLVESSKRSGTINRAFMSTPDPNVWIRSLNLTDERHVLAARYTGTFNTAFDEKSDNENHLVKSTTQSNLIVVADVDMLFNDYWVEIQNFLGQQLVLRTADNGTMVINAVDNMVGSNNLISLRSRGVKARNFDVVSTLRQKAESQFREQEEQLQQELRTAESRINELQRTKQNKDALILNDAQQKEIQKFQQKRAETRQQLRELQLRLNRDIENLGSWLKFLNIAVLPILLLIASFFVPSWLGIRR